MPNKISNRIINHYSEITKLICPDIDKHTILLLKKDNNELEPFASAILIEYKTQYFIVSATHVLEQEIVQDIYFETGIHENGSITFEKISDFVLFTTPKVLGKRTDDKIDLAVLKLLSVETINILKSNFIFYPFIEADIEHTPIKSIPHYIIFGYPASSVKISRHKPNKIRKAFTFNSSYKEISRPEKHGYDKQINIFLNYPKKLQRVKDNIKMKPPEDPDGLSGSGLWLITNSYVIKTRKLNYQLVGIMIEYLKGERTLIATKLKHIGAILKSLENS